MGIKFVRVIVLIAFMAIGANAFKIGINHFNDISGQIQSFVKGTSFSSKAPTPCSNTSEQACVGGVVNIAHHLFKNFHDTSVTQKLTLSSGNAIGGESGWITSRSQNDGWKKYAEEIVQQHYKPDVVALGMKEFGAGVARALDFAKELDQTVTLSNTCLKTYTGTEASFCNETSKYVSKIRIMPMIDDDNHVSYDIGVVGFVTPTVDRLSIPGKLVFEDVTESVKKVVNQNSQIKTFIAIGDGNLDTAKKILDQVPKVQLVVYGAGLSNTQDMSKEYPMKYKDGYIVTAGRYGSTIGKLVIDIDGNTGKIKSAAGKLVETVYPVPYDEAAKNASSTRNAWEGDINNAIRDKVAHSRVTLEGGEICWRQECNLGNLMADAMVHCALQKPSKPFKFHVHAIWHGGAFFEDKIIGGEEISRFDIHKWLPYHNNAHLVKIIGKDLWEVFKESVKGVNPKKANVKDWRQFLQVSNGLEVYISTKPDGVPKLEKVRMTHDKDGVPQLGDISNDLPYYLVIPTYLYEGRGVYNFTVGKWQDVQWDQGTNNNIGFDDKCLENYMRMLKHVSIGFEERIWIDADPNDRPSHDCPGRKTGVTVILTIVIFSLFLAVIYVGYKYVIPRLRRQASPDLQERYPPNQL